MSLAPVPPLLKQPTEIGRPLLKWAGGKRQLLHAILQYLPPRMDTYFEPFVGGGAVFFALAAEKRFKRAVLSDQNEELIATYRAIQTRVGRVIELLSKMPHSEEAYYDIRGQKPRSLERRAARMIYLNRTGYNGLYRVNRSGQFNVPFGRYTNPTICDTERLISVSKALSGVVLEVADFAHLCSKARPTDAVYFDPPYVPVSTTARFAEYHSSPFGTPEHERLAALYKSLSERGVSVVLSNSDTALTRRLFADCQCRFVSARRNINSAASRRGPTSELLVTRGPEVRRLVMGVAG
jgi:DNA adenine methylase